jgi:phosphoglucomutase
VESVDQKRHAVIKAKLLEMTPSLVAEVLEIFEADNDLVMRFGNRLPNIVEQEVIRLRDILLGAILLDFPPLLGHEINWLTEVAEARDFNLQTVQKHLEHYRFRLSRDLPPEYADAVVALFDQAIRAAPKLKIPVLGE